MIVRRKKKKEERIIPEEDYKYIEKLKNSKNDTIALAAIAASALIAAAGIGVGIYRRLKKKKH